MSSLMVLCPFLGCAEDNLSKCSYPSKANVCYADLDAGRPYAAVSLDHQMRFCLASYASCPVRSAGEENDEAIRHHPHSWERWVRGAVSLLHPPETDSGKAVPLGLPATWTEDSPDRESRRKEAPRRWRDEEENRSTGMGG